MIKTKIKKRLFYGAAIAVGVTLLTGILAAWNPLNKWQLKLTNRLYTRNTPSQDIVIVGIDENTVSDDKGLGRFNNWPILYYEQVVRNLEENGARVIGIDIVFPNKSRGISEEALVNILREKPNLEDYFLKTAQFLEEPHPNDTAFSETLKQYDNIVLSENLRLTSNINEIESIPNLKLIGEHTATGTSYVRRDEDEVLRRIPFTVKDRRTNTIKYSFSVKIAEQYGKKIEQKEGSFLINYAAPPLNFPMLSFANVYNGFIKEEDVKNKIVLIGVVTEIISDHLTTPTDPETPMPGVEVHANAIQTLLEGNFLHEQSIASQIVIIALLATFLSALVMFTGILPGLLIATLAIIGYHLAAKPFFDHGLILNLVYPTIALFLAYLTTTLYKTIRETHEKSKLKGAFGKYVNKDLVNKILENPDALKLGGEKRIITAFFSDIANFTHFSEGSTPEQLVEQLNEYFEVMVEVIFKNAGTLNKFEGDAIMAFWGAPLDQPDHAVLAAKAALECRAALVQLHQKWKITGKPLLDFRVGLSSGEAIAGNIGSKDRLEYTVMGDIVNLGSRLEAANKVYGTHVMLSGETQALLGDAFELRRLDRLRVKGKDHPVDVYELLTFKGQLSDPQKQIISDFHQALEYYRNGKFVDSEARFQKVAQVWPQDAPTQTYLKRCAEFKQNPPEGGWDGTWTLDHK